MGAGGRDFYKMSGSGNDFVFFDVRAEPAGELAAPTAIQELCARGTGVGADGVVLLEPSDRADFAIRYFNADGSLASLCGNASLCSVALAAELGIGRGEGLAFETGAGLVHGRLTDGVPEIEIGTVAGMREVPEAALEPGERMIGFALVGVPHLVVRCDDVARADVVRRGRELRWLRTLPEGANVNFVGQMADGRWAIRTYERGVEGETLACGTGTVATAAWLRAWGEAADEVRLETRSGRPLRVRLTESGDELRASLSGEGRVVFVGRIRESSAPQTSPR